MSTFGNYPKDEITASIQSFSEDMILENPDVKASEIVKEVMEAVSHGLEISIWNFEEKSK